MKARHALAKWNKNNTWTVDAERPRGMAVNCAIDRLSCRTFKVLSWWRSRSKSNPTSCNIYGIESKRLDEIHWRSAAIVRTCHDDCDVRTADGETRRRIFNRISLFFASVGRNDKILCQIISLTTCLPSSRCTRLLNFCAEKGSFCRLEAGLCATNNCTA